MANFLTEDDKRIRELIEQADPLLSDFLAVDRPGWTSAMRITLQQIVNLASNSSPLSVSFSGPTNPDNALGKNGDSFFLIPEDGTKLTLFQKIEDVWVLVFDLNLAAAGTGGNPTSGTLLSSDSPLVITWDTDLVPDDAEGRTYFEKHGALEKVSIQISMPDPANVGDNTYFPPNARFDEATKNILTIDNQGQKLYYVIGFGADGSSGGGGGGGLELGETSSTAYRGDRGKTAYDHSQITSGNPHGTTKSDIGLGSVDNTPDNSKPVSTAQQTAIDAKVQNSLTASTTVAPSATAVNTALSGKEDSLPSGLASEYIRGNKTLAVLDKVAVGLNNVDNTSDASKPVSTATQTALDLKAPIASPTFTGTVSGITKSMVGLGSVDNTADSAKPVSTAQQTALDLKAPLASPAFTGTPSLPTGTTGVTQTAGDSSTKLATTAFVTTADNLKAPLASPALTGTPTAPTASVGTNTTQLATMAALYSAVTQLQGIDTQTASYTLVLADAGKLVQMNVASANNLTIPLNSSVAFPVNTQLVIRQIGAGQTTIVATGGVTIQSSGGKLKLTGQYSGATLIKISTDTWALMGDITT